MKQIPMWEANDGSVHRDKKDAEKRDALMELEAWYNANKLYGSSVGCRIEWEEFLEWCQDNKQKIMQIIKAC